MRSQELHRLTPSPGSSVAALFPRGFARRGKAHARSRTLLNELEYSPIWQRPADGHRLQQEKLIIFVDDIVVERCYSFMILSFCSKETEKIWNLESVRRIPLAVQKIGLRKYVMLNKFIDVNDLMIPLRNRLEKNERR